VTITPSACRTTLSCTEQYALIRHARAVRLIHRDADLLADVFRNHALQAEARFGKREVLLNGIHPAGVAQCDKTHRFAPDHAGHAHKLHAVESGLQVEGARVADQGSLVAINRQM
jgi:hypothetical protein